MPANKERFAKAVSVLFHAWQAKAFATKNASTPKVIATIVDSAKTHAPPVKSASKDNAKCLAPKGKPNAAALVSTPTPAAITAASAATPANKVKLAPMEPARFLARQARQTATAPAFC